MRSAALTLALLILLSGAAPATALVPTGVDDGQVRPSAAALASGPAVAQVDSEPPATRIRVRLEADTDARWSVTYRYTLTDEDEMAAFRALGRQYENGEAGVGFDAGAFRTIAADAAEATGRNMAIRDVEREASVVRTETTPGANDTATGTATPTATAAATGTATDENATATGVLRLSFTWTNFLERVDDGTLRLGDVFVTEDGGTWLSSLGEDQQLVVVTPPEYVISRTSFPVQTQNGSLVIDGPREFASEERLVVTYRASGGAELPWTLIGGGGAAAVVVLALVAYVAFVRGRGRPTGGPESPDATVMTNGGETTAGGSEPPPDERPSSPGPASGPGTGEGATAGDAASDSGAGDVGAGAGAGAAAAGDGADDGDDEEPDFDLLSDEERVEYLLEQRGGRMKQANIVKETGWSDAKVSQLLSSMADEGRVEKLRLGRENLISIPDDADESAE
jgi:uncharacterized membrane protein